MYISLSTIVAFALPFGITAERYIVTCGDGSTACSPSALKDLQDAGATVIENFPFGVTVVDAGEGFNIVVPNVAISLDLQMQLEETDDVEAIFTDFAPLYQRNTSKDGQDGGRRLQMEYPPFSGDDDFLFDLQWGHTAVRAVEAWNAGVTGAGVRVCVLDTGFDMSHPDLVDNINQELSIDFTGDIQDVPGRPDYRSNNRYSHGSHVAGTIAAANNGYGTIGVAPDAELVLIKVLDELRGGSGTILDILRGLFYAGNIGCDVINLSLGMVIDRLDVPVELSPQEYEAAVSGLHNSLNFGLNYASDRGATIIASSGNNGINFQENGSQFLRIFADFPSVLPINACGPKGWYLDPANADFYELSIYSDYGRGSEFCGPGGREDITFPDATASCAFGDILTAPCWHFDRILSTGADGKYYWSVGTSMAAPHASGVAALIISENPCKFRGKPGLVRAEMRRRSADKGEAGRDGKFGFGFVQYTAADGTETAPVQLNNAGDFVILAKSGIDTVPQSLITGNIGVSPIASTAITGFGLALDLEGQFSTASQITGKAFAASYGGVTAAALTVAVGDMETAYTDAAGRPNTDAARINLKGGAIGGLTLTPGVYTFQTGISIGPGTEVTFDARGNINAVFIMQTTGVLSQAANTKVVLVGGAQAKNIFWQVAGNAAIGADASMQGILLVKTDVVFVTGSSLNGRILAQTAVNLQMATITEEDEFVCA